ncbi:MAG TPA: hypothetical protein VIK60_10280 [Vicinamibacterales bacterium]
MTVGASNPVWIPGSDRIAFYSVQNGSPGVFLQSADGTGTTQRLTKSYALPKEAIEQARMHDYEGVPVRVVDPEHLIAMALQAGGAARRERAWQLLQSGGVNRQRVRAILDKHGVPGDIPDDV